MKIITTKQMKALESESVNHGVSLAKLMDNAGKALADGKLHADCIFLNMLTLR